MLVVALVWRAVGRRLEWQLRSKEQARNRPPRQGRSADHSGPKTSSTRSSFKASPWRPMASRSSTYAAPSRTTNTSAGSGESPSRAGVRSSSPRRRAAIPGLVSRQTAHRYFSPPIVLASRRCGSCRSTAVSRVRSPIYPTARAAPSGLRTESECSSRRQAARSGSSSAKPTTRSRGASATTRGNSTEPATAMSSAACGPSTPLAASPSGSRPRLMRSAPRLGRRTAAV